MTSSLTIGGLVIRRDGEMWCMTDLWRAAGASKGKRPAEWLRYEGTSFVEFLRVSLDMGLAHLVKTQRIAGASPGGDTWSHWQLALAYAQWLSPEFHARVNDVYRAYMAGQLVSRGDESTRLILRIKALDSKDYESAWDDELKLELARLRKITGWSPGPGNGPEPKGLSFAYGRTWRVILGDSVYEELKRRNPHPRDGNLYGQWVQEERLRLIRREDMVVTMFVARRATRWADYEREMRSHFRRAPIQLHLVGKPR
ncbi:MAG: KilA-N domain-containing protein [Gemmatimonadaceae bacterium]|nr:KilA-N domain-containing protein [Gemmatimonadaceae bacterium]